MRLSAWSSDAFAIHTRFPVFQTTTVLGRGTPRAARSGAGGVRSAIDVKLTPSVDRCQRDNAVERSSANASKCFGFRNLPRSLVRIRVAASRCGSHAENSSAGETHERACRLGGATGSKTHIASAHWTTCVDFAAVSAENSIRTVKRPSPCRVGGVPPADHRHNGPVRAQSLGASHSLWLQHRFSWERNRCAGRRAIRPRPPTPPGHRPSRSLRP